ncbi:MAG: ATP-binding cassette domain-containing protein [Desulfurococcaceae archaeon]
MVPLFSARIERCGYPGSFELRDVRFELKKGEALLVTGKSGSGKTTLLRVVTGTIEAAGGYLEGEVLLEGKSILEMKPEEVYHSIAYIPQEPWYAFVGYTVYTEVCHVLAQLGVNCTDADFAPLGSSRLVNRLTYTLSAGEVQRVLWLETMIKRARLIVLDEPLTYLDEEARRVVKHYGKVARSREMGIIVADHDPAYWEFLEPDMLILEGGIVKYHGPWSRSKAEEQGMKLTSLKKHVERGVFVKFKNVSFRYTGDSYIIKDFTESLQRGVLTRITGPNGSGKTTLLKLGSGILKPTRGSVERYGTAIYIPENTFLFFSKTTPREELMIPARGNENKVLEIAELLKIKHILDRPVTKLSNSERRRVSIAAACLADHDGYFIDEPFGGIDAENASSVLQAFQLLLDKGKAVVVATHDEKVTSLAGTVIRLGPA